MRREAQKQDGAWFPATPACEHHPENLMKHQPLGAVLDTWT